MAMADKFDIYEFPPEYQGRKTYVPVVGDSKLVASCYVYRGGDGRYHVHPDFGGSSDGAAARSNLPMPNFMRDIGEYTSTLDGSRITTRAQHRDHMKRHDVFEVGNEHMKARPEAPTRAIGETIKRHVDEIRNMPQKQYDEKVKVTLNG